MAILTTAPITPQIPLLKKQDYPKALGDQDGLDKFFTLVNPFFQGLGNALAGSLSAGNFNAEIISFQITTPPSPWLPLTLTSPWANVNSADDVAGYYVDSAGICHLTGALTSTSAITPGSSTIATLPVTPRIGTTDGPIYSVWGQWDGVNGTARLDVQVGGLLQLNSVDAYALSLHAAPQVEILSLSNISYPAVTGGPTPLSCFPKLVRLVQQGQPVDVWLSSCTDANNAATSSNATVPSIATGQVSWQRVNTLQSGVNQVQINNIAGLALGRTYNVRCWVFYSAGTGAASAGVSPAAASAAGSNG